MLEAVLFWSGFWLLAWLVLALLTAGAAHESGQNGLGYFTVAILFSAPIALLLLVAVNTAPKKKATSDLARKRCAACAEFVQPAAKICPHCRAEVPPTAPFDHAEFPKYTSDGLRYRKEAKGEIVLYTPNGPKRFRTWETFRRAARQ